MPRLVEVRASHFIDVRALESVELLKEAAAARASHIAVASEGEGRLTRQTRIYRRRVLRNAPGPCLIPDEWGLRPPQTPPSPRSDGRARNMTHNSRPRSHKPLSSARRRATGAWFRLPGL